MKTTNKTKSDKKRLTIYESAAKKYAALIGYNITSDEELSRLMMDAAIAYRFITDTALKHIDSELQMIQLIDIELSKMVRSEYLRKGILNQSEIESSIISRGLMIKAVLDSINEMINK